MDGNLTSYLIIALSAVSIISLILLILILLKMSFVNKLDPEKNFERIEKLVKDEFYRNREEYYKTAKLQREELSESIKSFSKEIQKMTESNEKKFDKLEEKVSTDLKEIRDTNTKKLEEMRQTVDEKLHETLEKRLGDSFKLVSERLELVHKGLGEMQNLATGVGDLKKVIQNVKIRGTWGEVQLGNLIEQVLAPDQYAKNVQVKTGSSERVDFAIKLPGRNELKEDTVWLPIDAKFPIEAYQRLIDAQEAGNIEQIDEASKTIEREIKNQAKSIASKYLNPPETTDFAFMFLPVEGLYAEILRHTGLFEQLQSEYKVTIAGPTNFAAVLNSLQMGFRTLAIEKRSSEVWKTLAEVKREFGKFGDILEKTQTKLTQASNEIGNATRKSRTIERKLRSVEELPSGQSQLGLLDDGDDSDE